MCLRVLCGFSGGEGWVLSVVPFPTQLIVYPLPPKTKTKKGKEKEGKKKEKKEKKKISFFFPLQAFAF